MEVHLLVLEGAHLGMRITLPPTQFVIGRDPECHLRPASADVSRFHCAIARLGQQVLVRDLKSKNGTFLNERRLSETAKANDGDLLVVGPLKLQFQIVMGPGSLNGRESGQSWLVRNPNELEKKALDPDQSTALFTLNSPVREEELSREENSPPRLGSAVAGDFLREYLSRRKNRRLGDSGTTHPPPASSPPPPPPA